MKVQVVAKANTVLNTDSSSHNAAAIEAMTMEIQRLKSLLQLLLRKCGAQVDLSTLADEIRSLDIPSSSSSSSAGVLSSQSSAKYPKKQNSSSNLDDFDACISQELVHLKEENFGLLRDVNNAQEAVCSLREEKQNIMRAIFENDHFSLLNDACNEMGNAYRLTSSTSTEAEIWKPVTEEAGAGAGTEEVGNSLHHLQFQVLEAQREELDMRSQVLDQAEETQEERWQFLQQYHQWLHSQTAPMNTLTHGIDENVYRRVCLMEASVLLQADELQRTKKMFLSVRMFILFICLCIKIGFLVYICQLMLCLYV